MAVNQISVFLENRPGALMEMCDVLTKNSIDLRALSLSEANEFGIARILVDDVLEASTVLKDAGFVNSFVPVVAISIPDTPGGLASILKILTDAGVNLEYMYAFVGREAGSAYMVFKVADVETAESALSQKGLNSVDQEQVKEL